MKRISKKHIVTQLDDDKRRRSGYWSNLRSAATALRTKLEPGDAMAHLNAIEFLLDELGGQITSLDDRLGELTELKTTKDQ